MKRPWHDKRIGVLMGGISREREVSLKTGTAIFKALQEEGYRAVRLDVSSDIVQRLVKEEIEVAFIALHGRWGEDGTVQGLLELLRIPYTGSGVLASALAINKIKTKEVFRYHDIPTPEFISTKGERLAEPLFPPPWVVKPASEGSTIGIGIVDVVTEPVNENERALAQAGTQPQIGDGPERITTAPSQSVDAKYGRLASGGAVEIIKIVR